MKGIVLAAVFLTAATLGVLTGLALRDIPEGAEQMIAAGLLAVSAAVVSWMGYRTWVRPR